MRKEEEKSIQRTDLMDELRLEIFKLLPTHSGMSLEQIRTSLGMGNESALLTPGIMERLGFRRTGHLYFRK